MTVLLACPLAAHRAMLSAFRGPAAIIVREATESVLQGKANANEGRITTLNLLPRKA
jgi:hypothetical protein